MKNQPGTLENHKQWPRTMNDHKNPPGPMKNQPKPLKTDMEPWKTNPNCEKPWKPTWSCTGWLRVITGGYRRLPGGSDHFSWQTDRQILHHNIYITTIIHHHHHYSSSSPSFFIIAKSGTDQNSGGQTLTHVTSLFPRMPSFIFQPIIFPSFQFFQTKGIFWGETFLWIVWFF